MKLIWILIVYYLFNKKSEELNIQLTIVLLFVCISSLFLLFIKTLFLKYKKFPNKKWNQSNQKISFSSIWLVKLYFFSNLIFFEFGKLSMHFLCYSFSLFCVIYNICLLFLMFFITQILIILCYSMK